MKVIGVDLGDARTGIAVSDAGGTLAGRAFTIRQWNREKLVSELCRIAKEEKAGCFVVGNPKNMNATEGERSEKSAAFAMLLQKESGLPVVLRDERRTTVAAHNILNEAGVYGKKRKEKVDAVAAVLILQEYLDYLAGGGSL